MNWKAVLYPIVIGVPILLLLAYGMTRDPRSAPTPLVGNAAPGFVLESLDGDTVRLETLPDRPLIVNFWASWCIPCQQEHPLLVDVERRYQGKVDVVGIVYQDTRANARRWFRERGGDWTNVLDPRSRTAIEFGVRGVPETFFITRDRRILYHQIGPVTAEILNEWTPRLLAESTQLTADSTRRG